MVCVWASSPSFRPETQLFDIIQLPFRTCTTAFQDSTSQLHTYAHRDIVTHAPCAFGLTKLEYLHKNSIGIVNPMILRRASCVSSVCPGEPKTFQLLSRPDFNSKSCARRCPRASGERNCAAFSPKPAGIFSLGFSYRVRQRSKS